MISQLLEYFLHDLIFITTIMSGKEHILLGWLWNILILINSVVVWVVPRTTWKHFTLCRNGGYSIYRSNSASWIKTSSLGIFSNSNFLSTEIRSDYTLTNFYFLGGLLLFLICNYSCDCSFVSSLSCSSGLSCGSSL